MKWINNFLIFQLKQYGLGPALNKENFMLYYRLHIVDLLEKFHITFAWVWNNSHDFHYIWWTKLLFTPHMKAQIYNLFLEENKNRNKDLYYLPQYHNTEQWKNEWNCTIWMNDNSEKQKKWYQSTTDEPIDGSFFGIASTKECESCSQSFFFVWCHLL